MTYPGGKSGSGVYQTIINMIPPHQVYVEPFLGAGAILRRKRPAMASIAIDVDPAVIRAWQSAPLAIPNLTILQTDAITWLLDQAARPTLPANTVIYCDPPYPIASRRQQRQLYRYEMTDSHHEQLLDAITLVPYNVIISSYANPLYNQRLASWRSVTYTAQTRGGSPAVETVWCNYAEPIALHDYRYLGSDYRDRERIKRQQARWRNRLANMSTTERYAMLSVLADLAASNPAMQDRIAGDSDTTR